MELPQKILEQKIRLQKDKPFFAWLLLKTKIQEMDEGLKTIMKMQHQTPTACVDPRGIMSYDPDWLGEQDPDQIRTTICHEILHLALEHLMRRGKRQYPKLLAFATDMVVNNILVNDNFKMWSKEGYIIPHNNEFKVPGTEVVIQDIHKKNVEKIYDELKRKLPKNKLEELNSFDMHIIVIKSQDGQGKNDGKGSGVKTDDAGNIVVELGGREYDKLKKTLREQLVTAAAHARHKGTMPAGMDRLIDEILDAKVNWKAKLYKYITSMIPFDFMYSRPHKRSISCGYYIPGISREALDVVVAVDTSGSIDKEELQGFLGECIAISNSFSNLTMDLLVCDAEIQQHLEISNGNVEKIRNLVPKGGGGTSHKPVAKWIMDNKPQARVFVGLTDGFTDFFERKEVPPNLNVLWVITNNGCNLDDVPWGDKIKLGE